MAKVPRLRRLVTEDVEPKDRGVIEKIAFVFNPFLDLIVSALNKQLTFNDNFNATDMEITVRIPLQDQLINTKLNSPCKGLSILKVDNLDNPLELLTNAPYINFTNVGPGQIKLNSITGLTSGNRYTIRVLLLP